MTWNVEVDDRARRELRKIDRTNQARILKFLRTRIAIASDPRRLGKPLAGRHKGLWRYRVGDYRLACVIEDEKVTVLVVAIGHRSVAYR